MNPQISYAQYNFSSPKNFSKEQIRTLEMLFENFSTLVSNSLPALLKTNVEAMVIHCEQGLFRNLMSDLPPQTYYHLLSLAPLEGQLALVLDQNLNEAVLDCLLGGGRGSKTNLVTRELTNLDQALLRNFVEGIFNDLEAALKILADLTLKIKDETTNQAWVQMSLGQEWCVMVVIELFLNKKTTGNMFFYLPYSLLKPLLPIMNPKIFLLTKEQNKIDPQAKETVLKNLLNSSITIKAILGKANVPLAKIVNLKVGDIITLTVDSEQPLDIYLNNKKGFTGNFEAPKNGTPQKIRIVQSLLTKKRSCLNKSTE